MSVSVKLAEKGNLVREEPTYQFDALVSDIGGALGLVLGLSILDLLLFSTNLVRKFFNTFFGLLRGIRVKYVSIGKFSGSIYSSLGHSEGRQWFSLFR